MAYLSLRSSERGLKFEYVCTRYDYRTVAPFVGAWIEISKFLKPSPARTVAPFVGAWIEIELQTSACPHSRRRSVHRSVD